MHFPYDIITSIANVAHLFSNIQLHIYINTGKSSNEVVSVI